MTEPPELPLLPDIDIMREQALARRAHFEAIKASAEVEIGLCDDFLAKLSGKPRRAVSGDRSSDPSNISDGALRRVLLKLGEHDYAGIKTLATETSYSVTHTTRCLRVSVQRGYAVFEVRSNRRHRYRITDAGMAFALEESEAAPTAPVAA